MVKHINAAVFAALVGVFVVFAVYAAHTDNSGYVAAASASFTLWLVNTLPLKRLQ